MSSKWHWTLAAEKWLTFRESVEIANFPQISRSDVVVGFETEDFGSVSSCTLADY